MIYLLTCLKQYLTPAVDRRYGGMCSCSVNDYHL